MKPQWHPYLFLIFFATLFEYNLHRLITIVTNREALNSEKHKWVIKNVKAFYLLVLFSVGGFIVAVIQAQKEVLLTLAPIALLTLFYSTPISKKAKGAFRLRQIPYLKIFLISFVWSSITILLPVIQSGYDFNKIHVLTMLIERFLFVFAITLPFDIRDMIADKNAGLKTIPLVVGEKKSITIAVLALILFIVISMVHYSITHQLFILGAFFLSALTTIVFLTLKKFRKSPLYHYGILDGTMILQGAFVLGFHQLNW